MAGHEPGQRLRPPVRAARQHGGRRLRPLLAQGRAAGGGIRRAVDRVRSVRAASDRERRVAERGDGPAFDEVAEAVEGRLEREWVRRCLRRLTDLQRQAVTLAYYDGYTYREVAGRPSVPPGTVKTRMRDGLLRLRDCLGAATGDAT
ncbi:sigma factor-like helix-turn-helix DNA-binding protein [Streptomyces sp. NPDC058471]|uniref:sigma factor-like helix-turn-helix DNA-binding protein n=1 Tax=Streptomyces sp. NPDC058471 TaxID=3346516 RepID=UPI00365A6A70